jgi:hypothetical protein
MTTVNVSPDEVRCLDCHRTYKIEDHDDDGRPVFGEGESCREHSFCRCASCTDGFEEYCRWSKLDECGD